MDLKNFGQAIRDLAEEKGVALEKVIETVELAVAAAYKKEYGKRGQIIRAKFNPDTGELRFWQVKIVVDDTMVKSEEEIAAEEEGGSKEPEEAKGLPEAADAEEPMVRKVRFNPERHIRIEEAATINPAVKPGEELEFSLEPKYEFGRIASQTAKQVIIQRIREAEREATYNEYKGREGEVVAGIVQRIEGRNIFLDLGRGVGILTADEQIPHEHVRIGERVKALVLLVEKETRGPGIFLSRTHPKFLEKIFAIEVPEIPAGTVEIKHIAREPGSRSKVAVASNDPAVDPVGSLVGQRGVRVSTVINEIGGEKVDIVEWAPEPAAFIQNALSPAKVLAVGLSSERKEASVTVPEDQLSLAIGKGGQNVRLAAKLTGWKIDVHGPKPAVRTTAPEAGTEVVQDIPASAGAAAETEVAPETVEPANGKSEEQPEKPAAESGTTPEVKKKPRKTTNKEKETVPEDH